MDVLKPVTSAVKSCSNDCSMVLAYLLVFLMLPVDSLLKVNVQGQVKSALSQLLLHPIGRVAAAALFYVIWTTKDVMFLVLYLCLLNKIGLY